MKFKILLVVFSIFEIIAFSYPILSIILSSIQYFTILLLSIKNKRRAAQLFIMLNLISFGEWTYVDPEVVNNSYLNIRLGVASVNFFIAIYFVIILWRINVTTVQHKKILSMSVSLIVLSMIGAMIYPPANQFIYPGFIKDLKFISFLITFFLLIKLSDIHKKDGVLTTLIIISIIQNTICILTNIYFDYGGGNRYLPLNAISYFFPVLFFYPSDKYRLLQRGSILFVFLNGYFFSGKAIVMTFICFLLWLYHFIPKSKTFLLGSITFFILVTVFVQYGDALLSLEFADPVIQYKFYQFQQLFKPESFELLMDSQTSIGNIIAEIWTFLNVGKEKIVHFFFGFGLGGGMPDSLGLLEKFAGKGGYSIESMYFNNYYSMHLPLTQILLKTGILGFLIYVSIFFKILRIPSSENLKVLFAISFLFVFYVSKENILLHFVLINLILYGHSRLHQY